MIELPMRCAIYARYSSDLQNDRSIDDQVAKCKLYASRMGIEVHDQHIYSDRAISGASMVGRSGFIALLNAAAHRPRPFDLVIADDTSRLSRKAGEVQDIFEQLRFYGIGVYLVSQDIDSRKQDSYLTAGVHGLIDSQYRRDLGQKTLRGMVGQALRGNNPGGRLYGYSSIPVFDESGVRDRRTGQPRMLGARLEVLPEQAEIVVDIFELYLSGLSCRDIAFQLNAKRVEPPHNLRQLSRGSGKAAWLPTTIYLMLQNPRYTGDWSFNRFGWVTNPKTRQRRRMAKPSEDWQINLQPQLKIVDKSTFHAVQLRIQERKNGPHKRRTGAPSSFLLSGLMRCHECGSSYVVINGSNRNRVVFGCCTHHKRGPSACTNSFKVVKAEIELAILNDIQQNLLNPAFLSALVNKANSSLKSKLKKLSQGSDDLVKKRADLCKRLGNVVDAISENGPSSNLNAKLREIESEIANSDALYEALSGAYSYERLKLDKKHVAGWIVRLKGRLESDVIGAKAQLMSLVGEFTLTPEMIEGVKYLRIDGQASISGLLAVASGEDSN
ncbi:MAG: recombinase family protein [Candidatus Zixiibacteriota bacterium]